MADDKDKQKYSYRPNIEYQDTYESDYLNKGYQTVYPNGPEEVIEDMDIINQITSTFNEVTKIIPLMPAELQTIINGVYKPILDSWAQLEKVPYPKTITDPDKPIWKTPGTDEKDPPPVKFIDPVLNDIPEPGIPRQGGYTYKINNDGLWDLDPPLSVEFPKVDPGEIIKKEYVKNIADLFHYYVNRLKDLLYHYYSEKLSATFAKKLDDSGNLVSKTVPDIAFLFTTITDNSSDVKEDSKHLFDASVSMSERTKLKLCFLSNVCPVDQTLLHLKTFKTVYLLRLRYAEIDTGKDSNKIDAMSNRVLKSMQLGYNEKYDVSFMNLYKYLNSSLDILEDVINTDLAGLKARRTLIEKGGIKK